MTAPWLLQPPAAAPDLTAEGALAALRDGPDGPARDSTSFFTALGLIALEGAPDAPHFSAARDRMLDFLERCAVAAPPGAFAFWPADARPDWARKVPPDADDTALCLSVLLRAGRIPRAEGVRSLARSVLCNRVRGVDPLSPVWIAEGAFRTWLSPDASRPNVVDCAVNANVLTAIADLDMTGTPGADAAIRTICDGLAWAGGDPTRLRSLTPFYPDAREFALALERAVDAGWSELRAPLAALRRRAPGVPGADAVICSGAYRADGWRSPALHALRAQPADPSSPRPLRKTTAP